MAGPTTSVLLLSLLGLISADAAEPVAVPHAPVPQTAQAAAGDTQAAPALVELDKAIRAGLHAAAQAGPKTQPADQHTEPAAADRDEPVRVALQPLTNTYTRLTPAQIGAEAKAQVRALAKAHKPKSSGKSGVPLDWLPRETRKALGGNGPRDVVLLATTQAYAWYVWPETDAAWIGRVDLTNPTQIEAGPLPASGPFEVPGPQRLQDIPGHPLTAINDHNTPVPLISR